VKRDVRQLSQITDLVAFQTLAQLAALRTGQVLVISTLARDAKLNSVTAGRYLDLLEASFLIRRLPPFLKNRSSRLVKSPSRKAWPPILPDLAYSADDTYKLTPEEFWMLLSKEANQPFWPGG
jgi:predicted AAA+ superfamily ATPase